LPHRKDEKTLERIERIEDHRHQEGMGEGGAMNTSTETTRRHVKVAREGQCVDRGEDIGLTDVLNSLMSIDTRWEEGGNDHSH